MVDGNGILDANGTVNVNVPGSYVLTYFRTDAAGNIATQVTRNVTVVDTTKPVITLTGDANVTIEAGRIYLDPGATWTDVVDGNGTLDTNGTVHVNIPGSYLLTYSRTDGAGNVAVTVGRTVTVFNRPPGGINLSDSKVEEGMTAGTLVGNLSVPVDPDSNVTKTFSFSLVDGNGASGNRSFQVDSQGALRTATVLDFETASTHSVRLRAEDQFGGYAEKTFVLTVTDAFTPIVETVEARASSSGAMELRGSIHDHGHSLGVTEVGFVLGRQPDPELGEEGVTRLAALLNGKAFSALTGRLVVGARYYFRAYARNVEGVSYGTQERFTATREPTGPKWAKAVASGQAADWWRSPWFGSFYLARNGWLRHEKLGWLFSAGDGGGGVWLWHEKLGWVWTGEGIYPYLFQNEPAGWHYLMGEVGGRVFLYRFQDGAWIDVEEGNAHNDVSSP